MHIDATLDCVWEPDNVYARQQMLIEMSAFLRVVMQSAVRQLDIGRVWTFTPDNTTSEVRSFGYLEPANPLSMPAPGALKQVPFYGLDDPPWRRPDNEISLRADITAVRAEPARSPYTLLIS